MYVCMYVCVCVCGQRPSQALVPATLARNPVNSFRILSNKSVLPPSCDRRPLPCPLFELSRLMALQNHQIRLCQRRCTNLKSSAGRPAHVCHFIRPVLNSRADFEKPDNLNAAPNNKVDMGELKASNVWCSLRIREQRNERRLPVVLRCQLKQPFDVSVLPRIPASSSNSKTSTLRYPPPPAPHPTHRYNPGE